jgi:hypothetical protein
MVCEVVKEAEVLDAPAGRFSTQSAPFKLSFPGARTAHSASLPLSTAVDTTKILLARAFMEFCEGAAAKCFVKVGLTSKAKDTE